MIGPAYSIRNTVSQEIWGPEGGLATLRAIKTYRIPRSLTNISCVDVISCCWLTIALLSFRSLFLESKSPRRLGSIPPACLASLSLTSWIVSFSVIWILVGSFLIGFFEAVKCISRGKSWEAVMQRVECKYRDL